LLNFNGAPQLDPIINNGGNGVFNPGPRFSATHVIEAALVILVLIVIAVFAWRMFRSPQDTTKGP
jgi:cytochrome bd-type quinol oxidase subunit 1